MEKLLSVFDAEFFQILLRSCLAVVIGGVIGSERSKHGRAAGMRTHILVCLGAAMTSMTALFVSEHLHMEGDVFRLSAQVVSGIGFLGAGMIILKNNSMITGLTTAAGVWTTSIIGFALGYGFYSGAVVVAVLFMLSVIIFAKFERKSKNVRVLYLEIENMAEANELVESIRSTLKEEFTYRFLPPRSGAQGHLGIHLFFRQGVAAPLKALCAMDRVLYAEEES